MKLKKTIGILIGLILIILSIISFYEVIYNPYYKEIGAAENIPFMMGAYAVPFLFLIVGLYIVWYYYKKQN